MFRTSSIAWLASRLAVICAVSCAPSSLVAQPTPLQEFPTEQPRAKLEFESGWSRAAAFSPNGKRFVVGSSDGRMLMWNVAERKLIENGEHQGAVTAVAFSADGSKFVSSSNNGTIQIWQTEPLNVLRTLKGHQGSVECLAVNDKKVYSGGADGVRIWNMDTGEQTNAIKSSEGSVLSLTLLAKGTWLVAGTDSGKLLVWRKLDAAPLVLPAHKNAIRALAASSDGAWLAAAGAGGTVTIWDAKRLRKVRALGAHPGTSQGVAFSPDGKILATAGGGWDAADPDRNHKLPNHVSLWETPTGIPLLRLGGSQKTPLHVAFAPSGQEIAAVGGDPTVLLWRSPFKPDSALPTQKQIDALTQTIKKGGLPASSLANLYEQRGFAHVRLERWQAALDDFNHALESAPNNNMHLLRAGILAQFASNQPAATQAARGLAKLLSADSNNMYLAERVLKVCALPNPPVGDREHLITLAEQSVNRSGNLAWGAYFPATAAIMHYRFRQFDKALADVAESRRRNQPKYRPHLPEMMNLAITAMCLTRTHKLDEASEALDALEKLMESSRGTPNTAGLHIFHDWLTCELLYLEAREVYYVWRHGTPKP